jgi:hypothetical protein
MLPAERRSWMRSHSTFTLCDACGKAIADESAKEVLYQVDKLRYRLELCAACLGDEIKRHNGHRGIPGFRKRAAIVFIIESTDALPRKPLTVSAD